MISTASAVGNYDKFYDRVGFGHSASMNVSSVEIAIYARKDSDVATISSISRKVMSALPEFYGYSENKCKNLSLLILEAPESVINDRDVMSFLSWHKWGDIRILGVYDSLASPHGTGTIFLSRDRGTRELEITVVHELVHYWQDTRCLNISEREADRFVEFFMNKPS
tara:strand:+ start:468 stop:968 length:501 start_codon:yes stop_codon:yes gene_type:complete